MTLRQDELIRRLPENGFNISKTARQVGYTEQGSKSGTLYESLRAKISKAYEPETIKAKILKYEKKFVKDGDNSNLQANLTLQAKIVGLTKENNNTQVSVFTGDMIKDLPPVDITPKPEPGKDKESTTTQVNG